MSLNPFIAAGLLDGPWVFIALLLVSGAINWLAKLRAKKTGDEPPAESKPSVPPVGPAVDWETRLRRMLGEEIATPPAPPPVPPGPATANPARAERRKFVPPVIRVVRQAAPPPLRPPVVPIVAAGPSSSGVKRTVERYEQRVESGLLLARLGTHRSQRRTNALGMSLRNPQTARQAFVASLVFGPPKGLEE